MNGDATAASIAAKNSKSKFYLPTKFAELVRSDVQPRPYDVQYASDRVIALVGISD